MGVFFSQIFFSGVGVVHHMVVTISPSIPSPIMQGKKGISVIKVAPICRAQRFLFQQPNLSPCISWSISLVGNRRKTNQLPKVQNVQRFLLEGSYSPYPGCPIDVELEKPCLKLTYKNTLKKMIGRLGPKAYFQG